jgi:hypothetical protein
MIFVPFTGVDHHNRCVSFGAGLLYDETVDSYVWLLQMFIRAHKRQPSLVLTDQDASMRKAVSTVFNTSAHRLCMWHIMRKLPAKVIFKYMKLCLLFFAFYSFFYNYILITNDFKI